MAFTFTINGHTYTSDPANTGVPEAYRFIGYNYLTALGNLAVDLVAVATAAITNAETGAITISYAFDTATADVDPGAGVLRLNNATQNASTAIRADLLDRLGGDRTSILDTFDDSTSTVKGQIELIKRDDATKWLSFGVSAVATPAGYRNISVANVGFSAISPFISGDVILLRFTRTGDKGDTGADASVAVATHAAANKATPVDADEIPVADSAAAYGLKHILWSTIKTTLGFVTGILASSAGGTGNGFTKFTGPTTSEKTFTLPDANASLATLGANTFIGVQLATAQPAFLALAATQSNVTGDNADYTITFTNVIFNQGGNFDGTSTFTASATGKHRFECIYALNGLHGGAFTQIDGRLVTTNETINWLFHSAGASTNGNSYISCEAFTHMNAGDVAVAKIVVLGSTKTVSIAATACRFSGNLEC